MKFTGRKKARRETKAGIAERVLPVVLGALKAQGEVRAGGGVADVHLDAGASRIGALYQPDAPTFVHVTTPDRCNA